MSAFERRMERCPEVTQCAEVAGDVDYLLTVVARDLAEFRELHVRSLPPTATFGRIVRCWLCVRQRAGTYFLFSRAPAARPDQPVSQ
jgi:DNA-binding Lrp family transcriptional regulator